MMVVWLIFLIVAYLVGSVNTSIILFKVLGKGDPRDKFSKNPGATNVYRQLGLPWAAGVVAVDAGKALLVGVLALFYLEKIYIPWVALALVAGNAYPCFHQFKGGKGVAHFMGFCLAISPFNTILGIIGWGLAFWALGIPFIASFIAVLMLTVGLWLSCGYHWIPVSGEIFTVLFIVFNHRTNIIEFVKNLKGDE